MSEQEQNTKYPRVDSGEDSQVYYLTLEDLFAIDPTTYFETSGEAVAKAEKLDQDAWKLAGLTRKLLNAVKKSRGDSKYLEVTHEDMDGVRALICRRKDPRGRKK